MFKTTNSKRVVVGKSTLFPKRPSTPTAAAAAAAKNMKNDAPSSTFTAAAPAVPAAPVVAPAPAPALGGKIKLLPNSEGEKAIRANEKLLIEETTKINKKFNSKKREREAETTRKINEIIKNSQNRSSTSCITGEKKRQKAAKVTTSKVTTAKVTTTVNVTTAKVTTTANVNEKLTSIFGDVDDDNMKFLRSEGDEVNIADAADDDDDHPSFATDSDEENMRGNDKRNAELNAEELIKGTAVVGGGEMETAGGGGVVLESVHYLTYDDKLSVFVVGEKTTMADLNAQFATGVEMPAQVLAEAHNTMVHYVTSYIYAAVIVKQREHEEALIEREKNKKRLLTQGAAVAVAKVGNEEFLIDENGKMPLMKILYAIGELLINFALLSVNYLPLIILSF
jgi:hypothetical protein